MSRGTAQDGSNPRGTGGRGVRSAGVIRGGDATIEIVPMRRRHLRAVLRIEAHNDHRPWSLGLFMSELRQADARVYAVAQAGGRVVGFGGELFAADDAHITTIAVDPVWRRRGVASGLLLLLARQAARRGMTALTLEVAASNTGAQALYGRFGLAPVGVRKKYYEDIGEDALVMWAHDVGSADYAARLDRIEAELTSPTSYEGWSA